MYCLKITLHLVDTGTLRRYREETVVAGPSGESVSDLQSSPSYSPIPDQPGTHDRPAFDPDLAYLLSGVFDDDDI